MLAVAANSRRGNGWHGESERPAGRRGRQDEPVNPIRVVNGQFLGHHAAEAHAHNVGSADTCVVERGDDVASHVGDAKRTGGQVAQAASPVVHQHQPEMPAQLPRYRLPAVAVNPIPSIEPPGRRQCSFPRSS